MNTRFCTILSKLALTPAVAFLVAAAIPMGLGTGLMVCGAVKSASAQAAAEADAAGEDAYLEKFAEEMAPYLAEQRALHGAAEDEQKKEE